MNTMEAAVARLEQQGVGIGGTSIFAGSDTNIPTVGTPAFLTLLETAGRPPIGAHNASSIRQPSIQITARGDFYPEVATLIELAYLAMGGKDSLANIAIGDIFFLSIRPQQDTFQLPNDVNGRVRLAFNVLLIRR